MTECGRTYLRQSATAVRILFERYRYETVATEKRLFADTLHCSGNGNRCQRGRMRVNRYAERIIADHFQPVVERYGFQILIFIKRIIRNFFRRTQQRIRFRRIAVGII